MIGRLHGVLLVKQPPSLLLDVNGVGYEVEAPMSTIYNLPECGQTVTLHTHLHVREDAQILYGFSAESERQTFRQLIKVNGIGAKMALAVLSGMNPDEFRTVIETGDRDRLTRVPGIGKKTAERLLVELRDRTSLLDDWVSSGAPPDAQGEAVEALIALGYSANEAKRLIKLIHDPALSAEDLIRQALKKAIR